MKYYLVNYLILEDKTVLENEYAYIPLHNFANIEDFKQTIAMARESAPDPDSIVIKTYKQVSQEEFEHITVKEI